MRAAMSLLAATSLLAACEHRPPEPVSATPAPPASAAPSVVATIPAARPSAAASSGQSAPRCVVALPAAPPPAPPKGPDPRCPRDPEGGPPMVPVGHVAFPDAKAAPRLEVELMLTEPHQARGLMYRKQLADDHGMLFAFAAESVHTFWMHDTCLPLDMLFVDRDGFVAGIVENAPTLDDDGRSIACPVAYVLEVNAGWARRHGVAPGQRLVIDGVPGR